MGLFTKHSSTHFMRDKEGRVISTTTTGDDTRKESVFDRSARNRKANQEVRQKERQERRYENKYQRKREHEAYREARNEERVRLKGVSCMFMLVRNNSKKGFRSEQGRRSAQHPVTGLLPPRKRKHQMTPAEFQKRIMKGFR